MGDANSRDGLFWIINSKYRNVHVTGTGPSFYAYPQDFLSLTKLFGFSYAWSQLLVSIKGSDHYIWSSE